jgi:hypothetical protein
MADQAPISLYLAIADDRAPDLEVVARMALAWNSLIKEVIGVIDPSLNIRVEFLSGTIGSRSINSVVRAVTKVSVEHPWTVGPLLAIAGVFLLAPVNHAADDLTNIALKAFFNHEDSVLVEEDFQRLSRQIAETQRNQVAAEIKREIYRQAEREPAITGISATRNQWEKPAVIVPRSSFVERIGHVEMVEETVARRDVWRRNYPVVVVRPYSKAEERRWRFEHQGKEFSATMRDRDFIEAIRSGHTGVEVGEGVEMRIDLRIREEKIGGLWHEKAWDVMRVVFPVPTRQHSFELTPNKPDKPDK